MKRKRLLKVLSIALLSATIVSTSSISAFAYNGGWVNRGGTWYYLNPDFTNRTGWVNDNGTWYYLNAGGEMRIGWLDDRGTWYYLQSNGAMKTGWLEYKDKWYYFNQSGAMQTGWVKYNGDWYYLNDNGEMQVGKQTINDSPYFFEETGKEHVGWVKIDDMFGYKTYYYDENGNLKLGMFDVDGKIYYGTKYGCEYNKIIKYDGNLYIFNFYNELDKTEGLIKFSNYGSVIDSLGYGNGDGTAATGLKIVDGKKYYFNNDGYAATGIVEVGNTLHYFDFHTHELMSNVNYYGISTNEYGQVIKIDVDKALEDVKNNASNTLDKLKEEGEISIKYREINAFCDAHRVEGLTTDIVPVEEDKEKRKDGEITYETVMAFDVYLQKENNPDYQMSYYVSLKDGRIFATHVDEKHQGNLVEIKNNNIVQEYSAHGMWY